MRARSPADRKRTFIGFLLSFDRQDEDFGARRRYGRRNQPQCRHGRRFRSIRHRRRCRVAEDHSLGEHRLWVSCRGPGDDAAGPRQAVAEGVSIGVHPSFNDLWGFGRRRIDMNPRELEYMIAYQIGALQAMACYAGAKVTHLKPHGALNNMAAEDIELALAIGRAIKTVDRDIVYVALAGSQMEKAGRKLGLPVAREGFCDRLYDDDGNLTSRKIVGAVLHDPEIVKERVVNMVLNDEIISRNGKPLRV